MKVGAHARGSYTHELALEVFPNEDIVVLRNPAEVIEAVADGTIDVGLIPFFNLYAETVGVPVHYRLLLERDVFVNRVIPKTVPLCLAALPHTTLRQVRRLYLMRVLRQQCDRFVNRSLTALTEVVDAGISSTPAAMARAREAGRGAAAVGPKRAALAEGLIILADRIENPGNTTFFFLISGKQEDKFDRELLCCELNARLSEEEALAILSRTLRDRDCLIYDLWLEDKVVSGEHNHLVIVELALPAGELNATGIELGSPEVLSWRSIGSVESWR